MLLKCVSGAAENWMAGRWEEGRQRGSAKCLSMELVAGSRGLLLQCQSLAETA